jgi:hypothetical protein
VEFAMTIRRFKLVSLVLLAATASAGGVPKPLAPVKDLGVLEQKLIGTWKGQGGCTGVIDFNSDGTFEWRHYGPGDATRTGKWTIRWDALPPTLVLTLKSSKIKEEEGKDLELKITTLDDSSLSFRSLAELRYLRKKE